ncbi:MAG: hypothetical protein VYC59_01460, partial [Chloroflexota bacterium]|nr:hypothetical protein [Chloroflexota bacterium]
MWYHIRVPPTKKAAVDWPPLTIWRQWRNSSDIKDDSQMPAPLLIDTIQQLVAQALEAARRETVL